MHWLSNLVEWVKNTYNVNPYIFIFLYLVSIPIYWWGLYDVVSGSYRAVKERSLSEWQIIVRGIIINRLAWIMPYAYVMLSVRRLPIIVWIFLICMLTLSTSYFLSQVYKGKIYRKLPSFLKRKVEARKQPH